MAQKIAQIDSVTSAIASPDPSADGSEAPLRVDSFGNLHVTPHTESAASTPEPLQNVKDITLLASALRTADTNTADQTNVNHRGVTVFIDVTVDLELASVTYTIQGKDAISGSYYTLLASAAIAAVGTTVLHVMPGAVAVGNSVANLPLPRVWRVNCNAADGDDLTYSVGASLHL